MGKKEVLFNDKLLEQLHNEDSGKLELMYVFKYISAYEGRLYFNIDLKLYIFLAFIISLFSH